MKALVVGASGELGRAIARRLADDGYSLVLHGHTNMDTLGEVAADLPEATVVQADVRRYDQVEQLVERAVADSGLDVVVYVAGINRTAASVETMELDDWNDTLAVNLTGAFITLKLSLPHLRTRRGRVVVVSSIFGLESPANRSAYGASKHALIGLVQSLAREERDLVRVNAVCPGPIWSESVRRIFARHAKESGIDFEDYVKQRILQIPAGRFLETSECAEVVAFLCSPVETFLTGEALRVTGGSAV